MNLKLIDGLILDADGVLFRGDDEIGDLEKIFRLIQKLDLRVVIVSNNSTRHPSYYVDRLGFYGTRIEPAQVVTSAIIAANHLHQLFPQGGAVYAIGEKALIDILSSAGFYAVQESSALAVVVGLDRCLTYEKLKNAAIFIQNGSLFIATNADRTVRTHEGLIPAAGTIVAALEAATGAAATVMGKPQTAMYSHALGVMGLEPHQVLVIGDHLATDMACAQTLGCPTALVLSGVTDRESAWSWTPELNIIADDLGEVIDLLVEVK